MRILAANVYGLTKTAAEDLCKLFHRNHGLACLVLRTSRFFPEEDDRKETRQSYDDSNVKANEFLYRRVDIEDVVSAHLLALEKASSIGFGRYIITATTPRDTLQKAHTPWSEQISRLQLFVSSIMTPDKLSGAEPRCPRNKALHNESSEPKRMPVRNCRVGLMTAHISVIVSVGRWVV